MPSNTQKPTGMNVVAHRAHPTSTDQRESLASQATTYEKDIFDCHNRPSLLQTACRRLRRCMALSRFHETSRMFESSGLFLPRADRFADSYEGSYSRPTSSNRAALLGAERFPTAVQQMRDLAEWLREWTYISCWHMNGHESAAMWSLYCRTEEAVAVRSTCDTLRVVLPERVMLGMVQYIDYDTDEMPCGNTFWPFVYKRRSFEHEREVHAIIQQPPSDDGCITIGTPNPDAGVLVGVDLMRLVQTVYVAPRAPRWFTSLAEKVVDRFGLNVSCTPVSAQQFACLLGMVRGLEPRGLTRRCNGRPPAAADRLSR